MISNERLIGVAEVLNKKEGRVFDLEDEALLEALSAHAAIALERAQLTEAYIEKQRMEEALRLAKKFGYPVMCKGQAVLPGAKGCA